MHLEDSSKLPLSNEHVLHQVSPSVICQSDFEATPSIIFIVADQADKLGFNDDVNCLLTTSWWVLHVICSEVYLKCVTSL
jgi:hypothetical protein